MSVLPIVVVVDVDPDWRTKGTVGAPNRSEMGWRGIEVGVPSMLELAGRLRDPFGSGVRFTWLLRSDTQMATLFGDPAFVADKFGDFWRTRLSVGDEVGWHPHAWRYSEKIGRWYQERTDPDWLKECLREGFQSLSRRFRIRSAKPGWTSHSNLTMRLFSDVGVQVDLSALPGMRYDAGSASTAWTWGSYDWSRAPSEPYHPSEDDYQSPGNGRSLAILEMPNRTFPIGPLRRATHALRGRSTRDFANPAKMPQLVRSAFENPPRSTPFVCYFHPEELLGETSLFRAEHVLTNLSGLLEACHRDGLEARMSVASELVEQGWWSDAAV